MNFAPILLFVYNRPEHTLRTLESLRDNSLAEESVLYVIVDGIKTSSKEELDKRRQLLSVLKKEKWCKEVIIEEKNENWGLANSIVEGVSRIIKKHGKVIVLEDDTMPLEGFLEFMNSALDFYQNNKKVMHISGYTYPYDYNLCEQSSYFAKILSCWGWGTWERAWDNYLGDVDLFLAEFGSKEKRRKFDIEGHANYFEQLILNKNQVIKSWAVKWYASWLRIDGISLFPRKSLIKNIGQDGTGVHQDDTTVFQSETDSNLKFVPVKVSENIKIRQSIDDFYRKNVYNPHKNARIKETLGFPNLKKTIKRISRLFLFKILPELKVIINEDSIIKNTIVSKTAKIYANCEIIDSEIGDYSYISKNGTINKTSIGKFCSIGPNLICGWGIHPLDGKSTSPMFYSTHKQNGYSVVQYDLFKEQKSIQIGHDVFIGMNVTILDGVTIGDGAVIGAGAVVSKNIPPYAVAVGNPIKIIKYRFDEKKIEKLLNEKWWDNFDIHNCSDLVYSPNPNGQDKKCV